MPDPFDRATFPEPDGETDPGAVLTRLLAFHRSTVLSKMRSLSLEALHSSVLPSGWTPLLLLSHLVQMEQRWWVWGFLGEPVPEADHDHDPDTPGRWRVPDDLGLDDLARQWRGVASRTEEILAGTSLTALASTGGRFGDQAHLDPPTLAAIALHVLQELARHTGHLDVVVELSGGPTGE